MHWPRAWYQVCRNPAAASVAAHKTPNHAHYRRLRSSRRRRRDPPGQAGDGHHARSQGPRQGQRRPHAARRRDGRPVDLDAGAPNFACTSVCDSALTPAPNRPCCQAYSVFLGLYGVGFLAAPALVFEQNFDAPYDKYHLYIARLVGVMALGLLYTWSKMDVAAVFPIAFGFSVIAAFVGPLYAQLQLETKPAHKVWGEASLRTLRLPYEAPAKPSIRVCTVPPFDPFPRPSLAFRPHSSSSPWSSLAGWPSELPRALPDALASPWIVGASDNDTPHDTRHTCTLSV